MKRKSKSLLWFFVATAMFSAASNCAHPVTPTLFISMNFPDYMFGVALACNLLSIFLFSPFWGKINTYISSRYLVAIGSAGYAFAQFLFGMASNEIGIIIARLLCGVFVGALFVGQLTYVVHISPDDASRGKNLTILATVNSVASPFGFMLGGLLGDIQVKLAIWTQVAILLATCVLYLTTCTDDNALSLKDADKRTLLKESNPFASFVAAKSFLTPLFFCMFLMALLQNLSQTCFDQSFNYYTKDQFGFSSGNTGLIKGGIGLLTLLANTTLCTWLIRKTDIRKSVIPVLFVCCLALAGIAGFTEVLPFVSTVVILYAFSAVSIPMLQNIVASHGNEQNSGLVMGFYNSMKYLGGLIGALSSGFLYDANPHFPFILASAAFGVAALLGIICYLRDSKLHPYHS